MSMYFWLDITLLAPQRTSKFQLVSNIMINGTCIIDTFSKNSERNSLFIRSLKMKCFDTNFNQVCLNFNNCTITCVQPSLSENFTIPSPWNECCKT